MSGDNKAKDTEGMFTRGKFFFSTTQANVLLIKIPSADNSEAFMC